MRLNGGAREGRLPVLNVAVGCAYAVLVVIHLVACARHAEKLRVVTKPLLMLMLLAVYLTADQELIVFVVLALVLAVIGDTLLLRTQPLWVFFGGLAFLLGHVMYVCAFAQDIRFDTLPAAIWLAVLVYLAAGVLVYRAVRAKLGALKGPTIAYITVLCAMNLAALLRFASLGTMLALATLIGALIFLVSDFLLLLHEYRRPLPHADFIIMLTYCLAQSIIIASILAAGTNLVVE